MKFMKICSVIIGILMIAAGIYCIINPDVTGLGIGYVVGVSMIVDAFGRIYAWSQLKKTGQTDGWLLASGIISLVFGIALIADVAVQLYMDMFIAYFAACWIMVQAIITIIRALRIRKYHKALDTMYLGKHWWVGLIMGILLVAVSVLCFIHPGIVITSIGIFIGLGIIVAGANMLTLALTPSKR